MERIIEQLRYQQFPGGHPFQGLTTMTLNKLGALIAIGAIICAYEYFKDTSIGPKEKYFSKTYKEARNSLLEKVEKLKSTDFFVSFDSLVLKDQIGSQGETLATDVLWLGSKNPSKVLLHSSGVHGVEGYAGSAIQLQFIDSLFEKQYFSDPNLAIILIHSVNPYGMSWWRRWNENNVDLNRNLIDENQRKGIVKNENYQKLMNGITATSYKLFSDLSFFFSGIKYILFNGYAATAQALAGGQYYDEKGLFYGGNSLQASYQNILEFLAPRMSNVEHFISLDVHTGLGPKGHDMLITTDDKSEWGKAQGDHLVPSTQIYQQIGSFPESLCLFFTQPDFLPEIQRTSSAKSFHSLTQEFGTKKGILVAKALYQENFFHQRAKAEGTVLTNDHWSRKNSVGAFYLSESPEWKLNVLNRGKIMLETNIEWLQRM